MTASKTEASDRSSKTPLEASENDDTSKDTTIQASPSEPKNSNERDVRKQLRKTHVEASEATAEKDDESSQEDITSTRQSFESTTAVGEERQPRRKRSLDETDAAQDEGSGTKHVRKRSKSAEKIAIAETKGAANL